MEAKDIHKFILSDNNRQLIGKLQLPDLNESKKSITKSLVNFKKKDNSKKLRGKVSPLHQKLDFITKQVNL